MADADYTNEKWLPVAGYEGYYEVSDMGRVRSVRRSVEFRDGRSRTYEAQIRRLTPQAPYGHLTVGLKRGGSRVTVRVHRLVLESFIGPCPEGMEGCHNDGDSSNNRLSNLRWDTSSANKQDMIRHGTNHRLNLTHCPYGHSLDAPNVMAFAARSGRRGCLACSRARAHTQRNPHMKPHFQQVADDYFAQIVRAHTQEAA